MTDTNSIIWLDSNGRTHAALRGRSYTVCLRDTGNLVGTQEGDPIHDGVSCEDCTRKLRAAAAMLLAAMEGLPT